MKKNNRNHDANDDEGSRPKLYLTRILRELKKKGKTPCSMAQEIADANRETGITVDRRKISDIMNGRHVTLSTRELTALDNWLAPMGYGLSDKPFFEKDSMLDALGASGQLWFLLRSYPFKRINVISQWDMQAIVEIIRGIYPYHNNVQFDFREFLLRNRSGLKKEQSKKWQDIVEAKKASLCSIGSTRTSMTTEFMLSHMFKILPFNRPPFELPFRFIFPANGREVTQFTSAFSASGLDTLKMDRDVQAVLSHEHNSGFQVKGEKTIAIDRRLKRYTELGIVAAQRRSRGRVWLVVAGLSAPSTFAAAKALRTKIITSLDSELVKVNSTVVWVAVEADVETWDGVEGDNREVTDVRVHTGPQYWNPLT
jgi:hypothetical protein